jgi:hypothetical protein
MGSSRFGSLLSETESTRSLRGLTGDSQAWVFNPSVPSGDALTSERTLLEMLRRGVKPRYALIEMCPPSIHANNPWAAQYMERQMMWWELPDHVLEIAREGQLVRMAQFRLVPLYGYRVNICNAVETAVAHWFHPEPAHLVGAPGAVASPTPVNALDWKKIIPQGPPDCDHMAASRRGAPYLERVMRNYRPGGTLVAGLERIVGLCRENGIEPILLQPPVTSAFRECIKPEMETVYRDFVAQFCQKHACLFIDYYTAMPDDMFLDYHHANEAGSALFSRRVAEELLAPLLLGRRPSQKSLTTGY